MLDFEADTGVTLGAGNAVATWADDAGGNDLTASGDPQLVPNSLNGHPTIAFDGVDDFLDRANPTGLPSGDSDRAAFVVVRFNAAANGGGIGYGDGANLELFSLAVELDGTLENKNFGTANDINTGFDGCLLYTSPSPRDRG